VSNGRERRGAVTTRGVMRLRADGGGESAIDPVAVEEPLEIRVAGETLAVTMRTPGEDHELALGLLLSEGVIAGRDDVGRVFHCGRAGDPGFGNVLDVLPGPGVALSPERVGLARRGTLTTAACGVCGRQSIDDLLARCTPLPPGEPLPIARLFEGVRALAENQRHFARTGGLHAAALFSASSTLLALREDVGRHNAVDKAVGALLLAGALPLREPAPDGAPVLLVVSGRVSFEIVQKAVAARVPVVCGVSAPTSLAIDLAARAGVALAGFARGERLNLYAHDERIALG
jgi:FdhD protein